MPRNAQRQDYGFVIWQGHKYNTRWALSRRGAQWDEGHYIRTFIWKLRFIMWNWATNEMLRVLRYRKPHTWKRIFSDIRNKMDFLKKVTWRRSQHFNFKFLFWVISGGTQGLLFTPNFRITLERSGTLEMPEILESQVAAFKASDLPSGPSVSILHS